MNELLMNISTSASMGSSLNIRAHITIAPQPFEEEFSEGDLETAHEQDPRHSRSATWHAVDRSRAFMNSHRLERR